MAPYWRGRGLGEAGEVDTGVIGESAEDAVLVVVVERDWDLEDVGESWPGTGGALVSFDVCELVRDFGRKTEEKRVLSEGFWGCEVAVDISRCGEVCLHVKVMKLR